MTREASTYRIVRGSAGVNLLAPAKEAAPEALPQRRRPPRGPATLIERRSLLERVREGLNGQLVIVQAPPGFGKTELLASAFRRLQRPDVRFVWMTIDGDDSDPRVFLRDLADALDAPAPAEAGDVEVLLRGVLAAMHMEADRLVVFLDDFQAAEGAAFRDCVGQLLRRAPDHVCLIIASRRRPEAPLARLRMRGLLTEIRAGDLAFTRSECASLLGAAASAEEAARLVEATNGWPALIHLALPLLREAGAAESRSKILAGAHPLFREFLEEEFLPETPPDLRNALQVCSILNEFPVALAAELAGVELEKTILADVERFAPAIEPVAQRPGWLRLNPILLAMLRDRATLDAPRETAALHIRAANWFVERGVLDKAVHHASHGGDFALAAGAIARAGGVNIFLRWGYTFLSRLLAELPPGIVDRSPALRLCHAVALGKQGQIQAAREVVDEIKREAADGATAREGIVQIDIEHIDALTHVYEDLQLDDAKIATLERTAADHASYDRWERGWMYNVLCIAYQRDGNLLLARRTGLRALACYREQKSPYAQVFMLAHLGVILTFSGRLAAALDVLRGASQLTQETQWTDENLAALVHIPLGLALYHQGAVADAEALLAVAMPVVSRGEGWVDFFVHGFGALARARFQLYGLESGLAVLDQAEELGVERILPRLLTAIALARIELLARGGLLESAADQMQRLPPIAVEGHEFALNKAGWPTLRERHDALIGAARLLILRGRPEAAVAPLERLIADAREREGALDVLIGEIHLTQALWALQRFEEALASLQRSIALARPQDFVQPFIDAGEGYAKAIRAITRRFGLSTFSADMAAFIVRVNGLGRKRRAATPASAAGSILSAREIEVLCQIDKGLSNKEIARDLGLSEVTVKFHLKNLFNKLGVSRRSLATSVARAAGFL